MDPLWKSIPLESPRPRDCEIKLWFLSSNNLWSSLSTSALEGVKMGASPGLSEKGEESKKQAMAPFAGRRLPPLCPSVGGKGWNWVTFAVETLALITRSRDSCSETRHVALHCSELYLVFLYVECSSPRRFPRLDPLRVFAHVLPQWGLPWLPFLNSDHQPCSPGFFPAFFFLIVFLIYYIVLCYVLSPFWC